MNEPKGFYLDEKTITAIDLISMHYGQTRADTMVFAIKLGIASLAYSDTDELTDAVNEVLS